jgi:HNH endonuclease
MPANPTRFKVTAPTLYVSDGETQARAIRRTFRWKRTARAVLNRDVVCCDPLHLHGDVVKASTDAHHILPISERADLAYTLSNLVGLCKTCHGAVERLERAGEKTQGLFTWNGVKVVRTQQESHRNHTGDSEKSCENGGEGCEKPLRCSSQATTRPSANCARNIDTGGVKPVDCVQNLPVTCSGAGREPDQIPAYSRICRKTGTLRIYCAVLRGYRETKCGGCKTL